MMILVIANIYGIFTMSQYCITVLYALFNILSNLFCRNISILCMKDPKASWVETGFLTLACQVSTCNHLFRRIHFKVTSLSL